MLRKPSLREVWVLGGFVLVLLTRKAAGEDPSPTPKWGEDPLPETLEARYNRGNVGNT